jgi:cyclopropane fatty-acyl-phospholipid synthase-like methyltransferase
VRKGGTAQDELGTIAPEHPIWLEFARGMAPMMRRPAQALAEMVPLEGAARVLDISASHGMWGMAFAQKYPDAQLVALDWAPVLELTRANAERAGLKDRFSTIAGNAFEVDFGSNYDAVLIPNFLHHFNREDCVRFLKKVRAALRDGGRVAIAEFVPNPDRVSPPEAAAFSFVMLAGTPEGDAYTLAEFEEMLAVAGFGAVESHDLPPMWTAIIAQR